jgi:DNA-directed RNA polymerase subunit RPC12/RpoP
MNKEIDHDYTDEIVCPYCGCEFSESYEFDRDSGECECYECGKEFEYYRHIEVTYCTYEITEEMKEQKRIKKELHRQRIEEFLKQDET